MSHKSKFENPECKKLFIKPNFMKIIAHVEKCVRNILIRENVYWIKNKSFYDVLMGKKKYYFT